MKNVIIPLLLIWLNGPLNTESYTNHPLYKMVGKITAAASMPGIPITLTNQLPRIKGPRTNYAATPADVYVLICNNSNHTVADISPINHIRSLNISPNYGSVIIYTSITTAGPWSNLCSVTSNSVVKVNTEGDSLFLKAELNIFNFTTSWQASPTPGIIGYNVYLGCNTNNLYLKYSVGNITNAVFSVSGTNIASTLYIRVAAFDSSFNESELSDMTTIQVPVPVLTLQ